MKNVFIIHGVGGTPEENWFPWLKGELESREEYRVIVPQFPTPEGQTLENWLEVMAPYEELLEDSIVIGHSLGTPFLLALLEKHRVSEAYFVGGFYTMPKESQFYEGAKSFVERAFEFEKIRGNCGRFVIFHSDNDPYVALERAEALADKLEAKVSLVNGAGHFNLRAGYDEFELLLEEIVKK
ncbi:hypothetical protein HOE67_05050 [Candidatus Peregrinibacteria bacterium]|jgi:uncharacterized protein|nr:hypothetical protein [Candidatus Peregrinibacteria bacterium]MBT4056449.1 hypothetical protein [Candidatus Peregrinibacteria bacterium]